LETKTNRKTNITNPEVKRRIQLRWQKHIVLYRVLTLAVLCLCICLCPIKAAAANSESVPTDYILAGESDHFELYVYEPTMSVLLREKATGALLRSTLDPSEDDGKNNESWLAYMQSGLVLTAIKGTTDTFQVDLVLSQNQIAYTYEENGFAAQISFPEYGFGLTVKVSLEGDDLVVSVPEESIAENKPDQYIGTVSLFPFMGYTYLDAKEGYLFIPDGNGALITLNDKHGKYSSGFSQLIYGEDEGFTESTTETFLWDHTRMNVEPQKVLMPVFGMMHTQDKLGYLAIVEEGEERASIEAQPNGVMVDYNRCYAKFLLRRIYVQPLNNSNSGTMTRVEEDRTHSNLTVRYRLLAGDAANYSGMAVSYRDYLTDRDLITPKDTSYRTRIDFLGTDREQFLISTRAVTMTTTEQIRQIFEELHTDGVENVLSVYKGWQKGGVFDYPITSYKADSNIGGTRAVTDLIKEAEEKGYKMYLYNDALTANPKTGNTTFNTIKMVNKRRFEKETWGEVFPTLNYLLPDKSAGYLNRFAKSYTKKGINNIALAGITDHLFSWSYAGDYYNRFEGKDIYLKEVQELDEQADLVMEAPFQYYWNHLDAFLDTPISASDYMYEDAEIPFLAMVLKGTVPMYSEYVNFQANQQEFRLQMVEAGVYPSFYLTGKDSSELIHTDSSDLYSTLYDTYHEKVTAYDEEFRTLANLTKDAYILRHEQLGNQVNAVTYDNGTVIYVNYAEEPVTVNGIEIAGLSYKVGEAHE
jgi:hypothetical protein